MKKTETVKIRLYSKEDNTPASIDWLILTSIDWLILTEEEFSLFEYLANNDYLADYIDYEVYNDDKH